MALARIITQSQACSRELALDLLARGYAVEIVSPDSIPNDIADLELRVDTIPGNQLIATVEAHNGERTASLEFLHQLKAPIPDFIRRPPQPRASPHPPQEPVRFNTLPGIEAAELPAEAPQLAPKAVSPVAGVLFAPQPDREEDARPILPPEPLPSIPVEPPAFFAEEASTIARPTLVEPTLVEPTTVEPTTVEPTLVEAMTVEAMTVEPTLVEATLVEAMTVEQKGEAQPPDRPAEWIWRAALAFAGVVLLALVLAFGMRRTDKAFAQSSGAAPAKEVAASPSDASLSNGATLENDSQKDPGQVSAVPVSPPAAPMSMRMRPEANSNYMPEELRVAKPAASTAPPAKPSIAKPSTANPSIAKPSTANPSTANPSTAKPSAATAPATRPPAASAGATTSHRQGADLIARDTVTYFDERASNETALRAKPSKRFAEQHQRPGKHNGGVIAASTVIYFDKKPAPKAANQNSGVQRQSGPN